MKNPRLTKRIQKALIAAASVVFLVLLLSQTVSALFEGVALIQVALGAIDVFYKVLMRSSSAIMVDYAKIFIPLLTAQSINQPTVNQGPYLAMAGIIMKLIIPLVVFAILFTAIKLVFVSASPQERSQAKNQLQNLLIGLILIPMSPHLYQLLINVDYSITITLLGGYVWVAGPCPTPPTGPCISAPPGSWVYVNGIYQSITTNPNLGARMGSYFTGVTDTDYLVIFCCAMIVALLAVLVIFLREILVITFSVLMPLTVFLYLFDFSKSLGRKFLKYSITWAFVPVVMSVWVIIAAVKFDEGVANEMNGMMATIVFMCMIIVSPLLLTGTLETLGAVFTSLGQLTGGAHGAGLVAAGQIMQSQSAEGLVMAGMKVGAESFSKAVSKASGGGGGSAPNLQGVSGINMGGGGGGEGIGGTLGTAAKTGISSGSEAAGSALDKGGDATMKAGGKLAAKGALIYGIGAVPGLLVVGAGAGMKGAGVGVKVGGKVAANVAEQVGKTVGKVVDKGVKTAGSVVKSVGKNIGSGVSKGFGGKLWGGVLKGAEFSKKVATPSKSLMDAGAKAWKAGNKVRGGLMTGLGAAMNPLRGAGRGLQALGSKMPSGAGKYLGKAGKKMEEVSGKAAKGAIKGAGRVAGNLTKGAAGLFKDTDQAEAPKSGLASDTIKAVGEARKSAAAKRGQAGGDGRGGFRKFMQGGGLLGMAGRGLKSLHAKEKEGAPLRKLGRTLKRALSPAAQRASNAIPKAANYRPFQFSGKTPETAFGRGMADHLSQMTVGGSLRGVMGTAMKAIGIGVGLAMLTGASPLVLAGMGLYVGKRLMKGTGIGAGLANAMRESEGGSAFLKGLTTRGMKATGEAIGQLKGDESALGWFVAGKTAGVGMKLGAFVVKTGLVTLPGMGVRALMTGGLSLPYEGARAIYRAPGRIGAAGRGIMEFDAAMKGTSTPAGSDAAGTTGTEGGNKGAEKPIMAEAVDEGEKKAEAGSKQMWLPGMEPESEEKTSQSAIGKKEGVGRQLWLPGMEDEEEDRIKSAAKKPVIAEVVPEKNKSISGGYRQLWLPGMEPEKEKDEVKAPPKSKPGEWFGEWAKKGGLQIDDSDKDILDSTKGVAGSVEHEDTQTRKGERSGDISEESVKRTSTNANPKEAAKPESTKPDENLTASLGGAEKPIMAEVVDEAKKAEKPVMAEVVDEKMKQQWLPGMEPEKAGDAQGTSGASGSTSAPTGGQGDASKAVKDWDGWQSLMDAMTASSYTGRRRHKSMSRHIEEMLEDRDETPMQ